MMYEGKARGGPRNGIKLTAGARWDGRVKLPGKEMEGKSSHFYKGYYQWTGSDWLWVPVDNAAKKRTAKPRDPLAEFNVIPIRKAPQGG
jgi:hypothetical protein